MIVVQINGGVCTAVYCDDVAQKVKILDYDEEELSLEHEEIEKLLPLLTEVF